MKVRNVDRAIRRLSLISKEAEKRVQAALLASATEMNNYAVVHIQTNSGTGKSYKRGRRAHIASAPGEYPNTDYGELVRGFFVKVTGRLRVTWGNKAKHALPLEVGTSRMAARPFMRPTYAALHDKISKRIADAVREALKAGAHGR